MSSSVHHQEFSTVHTTNLYGPVWHKPLLCVQWKTPDDGQKNSPKHVEFYSINKFEKLVYIFGFILRSYHDARSPERQISPYNSLYNNSYVLLQCHRLLYPVYCSTWICELCNSIIRASFHHDSFVLIIAPPHTCVHFLNLLHVPLLMLKYSSAHRLF